MELLGKAFRETSTGIELLGKASRGDNTGMEPLERHPQGWSCLERHPEELEFQAQALWCSWEGLFLSSGVILRSLQCSVPRAGVEELSVCSAPALWSRRAPQETARACCGCSHSSRSYNLGLHWNGLSLAGHSADSCQLSCRNSLFPLRICKETQRGMLPLFLRLDKFNWHALQSIIIPQRLGNPSWERSKDNVDTCLCLKYRYVNTMLLHWDLN